MMKKYKIFFDLMYIVLIGIGILQFFDLPEAINYVLGAVAICCGVAGCVVRFSKK